MSRVYEGDGEEDFNNQWYLYEKSAELALRGKRGKAVLRDLKAALEALPEHRLIRGALCTVGVGEKIDAMPGDQIRAGQVDWSIRATREGPYIVPSYKKQELIHGLDHVEGGEGVCAVGALLWKRKVDAGMDPAEAFASLDLGIGEYGMETTAASAVAVGVARTLAYEIASRNDETFGSMTPEGRYEAFIRWIDAELARPPLARPAPKPEREKRQVRPISSRVGALPAPLGL